MTARVRVDVTPSPRVVVARAARSRTSRARRERRGRGATTVLALERAARRAVLARVVESRRRAREDGRRDDDAPRHGPCVRRGRVGVRFYFSRRVMGLKRYRIRVRDRATPRCGVARARHQISRAIARAIARPTRLRLGRSPDRGVTSRIDEANGAREAMRRDATRREREGDARDVPHRARGARARTRATTTTRLDDVLARRVIRRGRDGCDRARRSGRAIASRARDGGVATRARDGGKFYASGDVASRANARARARGRAREGASGTPVGTSRSVAPSAASDARDVEGRRRGVATASRGATNGRRPARAARRTDARRGHRRAGAADRARAGWINRPRGVEEGVGAGSRLVEREGARRRALNRPREARD